MITSRLSFLAFDILKVLSTNHCKTSWNKTLARASHWSKDETYIASFQIRAVGQLRQILLAQLFIHSNMTISVCLESTCCWSSIWNIDLAHLSVDFFVNWNFLWSWGFWPHGARLAVRACFSSMISLVNYRWRYEKHDLDFILNFKDSAPAPLFWCLHTCWSLMKRDQDYPQTSVINYHRIIIVFGQAPLENQLDLS